MTGEKEKKLIEKNNKASFVRYEIKLEKWREKDRIAPMRSSLKRLNYLEVGIWNIPLNIDFLSYLPNCEFNSYWVLHTCGLVWNRIEFFMKHA